MKSGPIKKLRGKLARDECVYGMWVTLQSASITQMAVAIGLDWVVIDAECRHLDWGVIAEHLRTTDASDTVALVRVAEPSWGLIKRALDIGADGVIVPRVESAEQLRQAVSYVHGPRAQANENFLVIPLIEPMAGDRNVDSLLSVPGVDIFFIGPGDYTATEGCADRRETAGADEAVLEVKDKICARGKSCGAVATDNDDLALRKNQGFRMLGVGCDSGLLSRSLRASLDSVKHDRVIPPGATAGTIAAPLRSPPESMRPDRPEVITAIGAGVKTELARGVAFESLVGSQVNARHLTTGLVTFAPAAELPPHRHTFGESITLLRGAAIVEVEGRMYRLQPLDNVTVPRGLVHAAANRSVQAPAVFHIALASDQPSRELVDHLRPRRGMADDSNGIPGAEHVTRFRLADRYMAGSGASFIDYVNRELVPGIEMSGGYGLFAPGGRLPAHVHDFDESICIVQGQATCVVEGRRYGLGDLATALQPRGRVHYFINESATPMAMIWIYAGPMPERLVVDEACATVEGDPWR